MSQLSLRTPLVLATTCRANLEPPPLPLFLSPEGTSAGLTLSIDLKNAKGSGRAHMILSCRLPSAYRPWATHLIPHTCCPPRLTRSSPPHSAHDATFVDVERIRSFALRPLSSNAAESRKAPLSFASNVSVPICFSCHLRSQSPCPSHFRPRSPVACIPRLRPLASCHCHACVPAPRAPVAAPPSCPAAPCCPP